MITIYADDKKIYDPRIEKLQLEEAELQQAKNKAGSMTFTIPAAHTYAQTSIIPGITRIVVKEDEETIFKGRITKTNPNFYDDAECTAEGDLAYLNDTVVRPYEYAGSPREYFAFLIEQHNAQVEKERQFTVGRVTVADPNDYIVRSSAQYPSTWEELETKLLDSMGGFLVERWEDGVTYLDYLEEIRENNDQVAKYGENIVDIDRIKEVDSGFATAVIPLGKKQEAEEGKEAQYLTIESVNDGIDYVQNDDAVSKYGLILKTVEHEDVTLPENLLRKGQEDLAEAIKSVESITVSAADLSGTGVKVESFRFMKNVRCVSKRHALDFRSPIVSLTRNLLDRSDYKITVGDTQKSYTGASITSKRETESKAEEIISLEREARKKAIEDLVSKVEKAPGLYITDTGEGEAHNWYLHDKKTVEESYIIIRINTAGIIFSTDGGKTYNGVSWEGDAILKKIYAIGIDANYINAGELNAAIVKIKNLHLQDISDGKGVTLDATLDGITADVSAKYTELDGKISENSASISMLPDSITSTVKKSYIDPLTGRVTEAESDIDAAENRIAKNEKDILAARSEITQTASSITANVSALYQELDGKISKNSSSISMLPDSIKATVKKEYIDSLTTRMTNAESSISQAPDSIKATVKKDYIDPLSTRVTNTESDISSATKRITAAEASIQLNAESIESKVSKGSIISTINQSAEKITISADKIDFNGSVTFSNAVSNNSTVSAASKNASDALSTAKSASSTASAASTTASNASKTASDAASTASSAATTASNASKTVTSLSQGLSDGTTNITGDCIKTGTIWFGTESYINKNGKFRIGPMYSTGGTKDSHGYYGNQDVCFDKAIMINYGIEIYGSNDSVEGISYIDFHSGSDVTTGDSLYDYTGRLQNYLAKDNVSQFVFSGSKTVTGTTTGTCTVAVNGTIVHSSDIRLKEDIETLTERKAIDLLMALNPVSYKYIGDINHNVHHGLVYQNVKEIVADQELGNLALLQEYRGVDKETYGALGYEELIADLIKAMQYSLKEIEKLKTTIAA